MADRLRHITVESGHEAVTGRGDVDDAVIGLLAPLVREAIDTGARVEVPGGYGFAAAIPRRLSCFRPAFCVSRGLLA